jgi:hypothetical protein
VERTEGIRGKPEYAPPGIRHALVEPDVIANCVVSSLEDLSGEQDYALKAAQNGSQHKCAGNFLQIANQPEHKVFMGTADHAGYMILRLRSYPAWRVTVNGQAARAMREEGYGLIAVAIPQGPARVTVDWMTTLDVWVGRGLSALGFALLTALYVVEGKLARPRRS